MGRVIRKDAAAADVFAIVRETLVNAAAKGGVWKTLAEERLGNLDRVAARAVQDLQTAEVTLAPLQAALDAINDEADRLIGSISDDLWNSLGRPGSDPSFSVLFAEGISTYTDGPDDEQPARMLILANLLESGVHTRITTDLAAPFIAELRASADVYKRAVDARQTPATAVTIHTSIRTALARASQTELSRLKKRYAAEGFSEAEIHSVIPSVARAAPKPAKPPAG